MTLRERGNGSVGLGVIGARSMVAQRAVLPAIDVCSGAHLVAASALGGPVPPPWADRRVADYDAVIDHPDVEAVYVPLPNGMHAEWVVRIASRGKHVLCEKPLAPTADAARSMIAACDAAGVMLAEAWMTPFDPRWSHADTLVRRGTIGDLLAIDAAFTFTIGPENAGNYRWQPDQGGGALLDVGIYCLGPAVQQWGAGPAGVEATMQRADSGVDASTSVRLTWPDGQTATARCSFVDTEQQRLEYVGTTGRLVLDGDAHTGGAAATMIGHIDADGHETSIDVEAGDPYLAMIDSFAAAVRGTARWPRPAERGVEMLDLFDRIREAAT